jgi:23S rRNA pseudouridine955/2504/2580 synthase
VRVPPLGTTGQPAAPKLLPPLSEGERRDLVARILHVDDQVIVIDKPPGLAVQGGSGVGRHLDGMLDALTGDGDRPRLVHRLDRDTSGVLLLARTANAAAALAEAFRGRQVRKLYWAVTVGAPATDRGEIDVPLRKRAGPAGERTMIDPDEGRRALTVFSVQARAGRKAAWLELEPLTGRTHQLRAHCAVLGCPILGDGKYGGAAAFLGETGLSHGLHLHARAVRFPHPAGGEMSIVAPLPPAIRETFAFFGFALETAERTLNRWLASEERPARRRRRG